MFVCVCTLNTHGEGDRVCVCVCICVCMINFPLPSECREVTSEMMRIMGCQKQIIFSFLTARCAF